MRLRKKIYDVRITRRENVLCLERTGRKGTGMRVLKYPGSRQGDGGNIFDNPEMSAEGEEQDGGKITERYFDCPHCGKSYTIACMDKKMEEMIRKRQKLQKKIAGGSGAGCPEWSLKCR